MKKLADGHASSLLALLGIAALVVVVDQLTKKLVTSSLALGEWWSPIPNLWRLFRITYTTNSGAAFGMFPKQGIFFVVIAIVVVAAIVLYYRQLPTGGWLIRVSLGLQLGGAIGNLIDRLRFGYVIDWLDIGFWPIFNVADACITTGVILIAYCIWRDEFVHREANSGLEGANEEA